MAIEADFDLSGCIIAEGSIHCLNPATPAQKSLNVMLKLCPDARAPGNSMGVFTIDEPVSGLLRIAFVELAHGVSPATKTADRASSRPNQRKSCTTAVLASL
jgi:hypothetical protein